MSNDDVSVTEISTMTLFIHVLDGHLKPFLVVSRLVAS